MNRSVTFLVFLLLTSISLQAQNQTSQDQQSETEVLRVSTNLVTIPVTVKTHQGGYVANLQREDFRIYEDNVEQEVAHFEAVDKPFTVVLMMDMSDSTRIELKEIQNAAIAFLNQLRADDRAMIVAFSKQFVRLAGATNDHKALSSAINRVMPGGGTSLYDAVDTTINEQLRQIPGRKAIVLLTDGIDTSSVRATYESTIRSAAEQYALIYPIQWNTPDDSTTGGIMYTTPSGEPLRKAYERGTRYLKLIAQTSGGRFQFADNVKALERSFAQIAEELRQQYSLGYYPKNQDSKNGKRRVKVAVNLPGAVVHARDSYVYKSDSR